eukprot:COSAG01_NODE_5404_length_4282_cov_4.640210_2_plen_76_part_00
MATGVEFRINNVAASKIPHLGTFLTLANVQHLHVSMHCLHHLRLSLCHLVIDVLHLPRIDCHIEPNPAHTYNHAD